MEDEKIIDLYFARDEQALVQTELKYGSYCKAIAMRILENNEDAEEALSDTCLKAWNIIPPTRPSIFRLFLAKIIRNLSFSRWREQSARKRGGGAVAVALEELGECIPASSGADERVNLHELSGTIRAFLDTLPKRDADVFLRRYFFVEDVPAIAARYAMRPDSLSRSLLRTRKKLKNYLIQEGYAP